MTLPESAADVLAEHVIFEVECRDFRDGEADQSGNFVWTTRRIGSG
jgi:hypothetical protein